MWPAAVLAALPLPQRSPTPAPRGHLSPAPLLLSLLTPLTWNGAWGFPRWGAGLLELTAVFPFFSVCKEPPYKVEESGYAGFIMPIEVYFKNKVGARVAERRTHSSQKGR